MVTKPCIAFYGKVLVVIRLVGSYINRPVQRGNLQCVWFICFSPLIVSYSEELAIIFLKGHTFVTRPNGVHLPSFCVICNRFIRIVPFRFNKTFYLFIAIRTGYKRTINTQTQGATRILRS